MDYEILIANLPISLEVEPTEEGFNFSTPAGTIQMSHENLKALLDYSNVSRPLGFVWMTPNGISRSSCTNPNSTAIMSWAAYYCMVDLEILRNMNPDTLIYAIFDRNNPQDAGYMPINDDWYPCIDK